VPFLLLEEVRAERLQPSALILWLHYKRQAWKSHAGSTAPAEPLRLTELQSGLSRGTILAARKALAETGWIELYVEGQRRDQEVTIRLLERWDENCQGHEQTNVQNLDKAADFGRNPDMYVQNPDIHVQKLDKAHLKNGPFKTIKTIKDPQGGNVGTRAPGTERPLPNMLTEVPPRPGASNRATATPSEENLLEAFYRGLTGNVAELTPTIRRRELAIARELVAVGATPAEAEAYAREASAQHGRIAAVSMRSFEQERQSWLGRRRRVTAAAAPLRVANGRIPD
jgi:hypothetical protein